ncbi:MAG: Anthranilate phosphoribosyltransferase [Clostridiales bacterium 38_11]|nr:MAG: Anthranilate phosphoribosyltransferase [Clostridiales bacterium 38_11]HBH11620.1 anthranilate phosphoribosyltransferase [Clostridiales bacterium]
MNMSILNKLVAGIDLTGGEAREAMDSIMDGLCTESQIAAFLTALKMKGETIEEVSAFAQSIRHKADKIDYRHDHLVDCCGTGGDYSNTFNISTTAAFIAAGAGVKVAKHGNRSITSKSGGADVLEKLGVVLSPDKNTIIECLDMANIGFLFAPRHHESFKYAVPVRKQLGFRTVFNLLGPLVNPALVEKQVMGVYDGKLVHICANVLNDLGVKRAMVIHGKDGIDEITLTGKSIVSEVNSGKVYDYEINPCDYGFELCSDDDLTGSTPKVNAEILASILDGVKGPKRDIAVLNAAASIYISGIASTYQEGLKKAEESIDKGLAKARLNIMREVTRGKRHAG